VRCGWANDDNDYNNNDGGRKNVVSKEEWDAEDDDDDNDNVNVNEDDEYKERDDVEVGFDDVVTYGSGKEVEEEINDVVGTIVTMNDNASTLSTLTVPELKERLREARLPVSGKKSELIACLVRLYFYSINTYIQTTSW
jgi:hypothetical protein